MAKIQINDKTIETQLGRTIIEVADEAGIDIPRFCYHKKLSVAANCRMCLVEVSGSKKTLPACATPISDGMQVMTCSPEAIKSQKAVMEFLLINHPLDCPICDQGGECELQDVSMGYGVDHSEYNEVKRCVSDEDLGKLIATEMTRCIHCTRCVRFGTEIAGLRELGATGRGENTKIGTFIEHSMISEVSGNVIDLCPVGALTSKPYRFTARAWELMQYPSISPHDCLNSNTYVHVRRDEVMRVVPREDEDINQTWLSDRDRFAYTGNNHSNRALRPMIKKDGHWHYTDWETALNFAVDGIKKTINNDGPQSIAAFASASSTLEEFYLLQKLCRALGIKNLDYRLQQSDFKDQEHLDLISKPKVSIANLNLTKNILLVGCQIERELPLAAIRIRHAQSQNAKLFHVDCFDSSKALKYDEQVLAHPAYIADELAKIIAACKEKNLPEKLQQFILGMVPEKTHIEIANALKSQDSIIIMGELARNNPYASNIRFLLRELTKITKAEILELTAGGNSQGANLAGMLPYAGVYGKKLDETGFNVREALLSKLSAYILLNVEADYDFSDSALARNAMMSADFVVSISAFITDSLKNDADVILPAASYLESSGTYVNIDHKFQTIKGVAKPKGESRPVWKIIRVMGNKFELEGFDHNSSEDIKIELLSKTIAHSQHIEEYWPKQNVVALSSKLTRASIVPIYKVDMLTRHSRQLQQCASSDEAKIFINPETAVRYRIKDKAVVSQGAIEILLPVSISDKVAEDTIFLMNGLCETIDLGSAFGDINIKPYETNYDNRN